MPATQVLDFIVDQKDLSNTQTLEKTYPEELAPDQVLLKVDKFAFTANNITYGVAGERMSYWKFFPTQEGYGIIPTWGFADVVASNHPEIAVGQRYYGYYPMGTHLIVTAKPAGNGFADVAEHRQELSPTYNFYTHTERDPAYVAEMEELISLYRPLFITSFLIEDYLAEQNFNGATELVLTGASSKTAQALAFLVAQRKKEQGLNIHLIGLTSARNVEFVQQLGWYDNTVPYDQISGLDPSKKHVVVDFSGNHNTQYELQTLLKENLVYNCLVGLADWQNMRGEKPLPAKGEFFFAPTRAQNRQKAWGPAGFQQRVEEAWRKFGAAIQPKITLTEVVGVENLAALYLDMVEGNVNPRQGNMVRWGM